MGKMKKIRKARSRKKKQDSLQKQKNKRERNLRKNAKKQLKKAQKRQALEAAKLAVGTAPDDNNNPTPDAPTPKALTTLPRKPSTSISRKSKKKNKKKLKTSPEPSTPLEQELPAEIAPDQTNTEDEEIAQQDPDQPISEEVLGEDPNDVEEVEVNEED